MNKIEPNIHDINWQFKMNARKNEGWFYVTDAIVKSEYHRVYIIRDAYTDPAFDLWLDTVSHQNYCWWGFWLFFMNPTDTLYCKLTWE